MKTTNFENSKKLAEIGFKADTKNWWMLSSFNEPTHQLKTYNRFEDYVGDNYRAYDLETILEALPAFLENKNGGEFNNEPLMLCVGYKQIYYSGDLECGVNTLTNKRSDESLADTAARLLIALAEKKIINFK